MGVRRLQAGMKFCEGSFVERAHVREVLGLSIDPDDHNIGEFWSGLKTYLEKRNSTNRLVRIRSETTAETNSSNRKAGALVKIDRQNQTVQFVVEVFRERSPQKYDIVAQSQMGLLAAFPGCEFRHDTSLGMLRLIDTVPLDCADTVMSDEVYGWIDSRMTVFRQVVADGLDAVRGSE